MITRTRATRRWHRSPRSRRSIGLAACGSDDDSQRSTVGSEPLQRHRPPPTCAPPSHRAATPYRSGGPITVGFVAVGPEGAWRAANEANMQETFSAENGFDLKYAPATNLDQKSQIDAFTSFVDEGVDVILLSATEGAGWEDPLKRAQEAEIPVILIDRGIEPDDDEPVRHPHRARQLRGLPSGSPNGRLSVFPTAATTSPSKALQASRWSTSATAAATPSWVGHPEIVKIGAQTANWSAEEGKSVIETVLKANDNDIQFVFAQNDEMGLGAALAVEEAGLVPGVDVKIATIDGTKGAMEALAAARLSFVAEYNPLFGDTAVTVVRKALAGESVESYIIVPSGTFDSPEAAQEALPSRRVLIERSGGALPRRTAAGRDRTPLIGTSDGSGSPIVSPLPGCPVRPPPRRARVLDPRRWRRRRDLNSTDRRDAWHLDRVSRRESARRRRLRLLPGEVHALMGENGAGKSTLIKALTGVYTIDAGEIIIDGEQRRLRGTADAQAAGIAVVYQEVNLCTNLPSARTSCSATRYADEWASTGGRRTSAPQALAEARPRATRHETAALVDLSLAMQQLVAISRAMVVDSKVLILDEPTSSLDAAEVEQLFARDPTAARRRAWRSCSCRTSSIRSTRSATASPCSATVSTSASTSPRSSIAPT